jgi:hypothetical protein
VSRNAQDYAMRSLQFVALLGFLVSSCVAHSSHVRPVVVEASNASTFGYPHSVPANTVFYVRVIRASPADQVHLNRCGELCHSASTIKVWPVDTFQAGDTLVWTVATPGEYYLWSENTRTSAASRVVAQRPVGSALRMTFDSGAEYEAWYVLP